MIQYRCTCGELVFLHLEHEHSCQNSSPSKKPTTKPVARTEASSSSSPSMRRTVSPPEPVITPTVITPQPVITPTTRFQKWHAKNREAHNARMRAYRARQKAPE